MKAAWIKPVHIRKQDRNIRKTNIGLLLLCKEPCIIAVLAILITFDVAHSACKSSQSSFRFSDCLSSSNVILSISVWTWTNSFFRTVTSSTPGLWSFTKARKWTINLNSVVLKLVGHNPPGEPEMGHFLMERLSYFPYITCL